MIINHLSFLHRLIRVERGNYKYDLQPQGFKLDASTAKIIPNEELQPSLGWINLSFFLVGNLVIDTASLEVVHDLNILAGFQLTTSTFLEARWPHSNFIGIYDQTKNLIITFMLNGAEASKSKCKVLFRSDMSSDELVELDERREIFPKKRAKFAGIATPPYFDEFKIECSYYCQDSSKLCFLTKISKNGIFKLNSMNFRGEDATSQTFNVRHEASQNAYRLGTLSVCHQWQVRPASHGPRLHNRALCVLAWEGYGQVQLAYLRADVEHNHYSMEFLDLFKNTFPIPEVVQIFRGIGNEIILEIKCKNKHFLRVLDFPPPPLVGYDLTWLGDIPLIGEMNKQLSFKHVFPLTFRFDSHDSHAESFMIENRNKDSPQVPVFQLVRTVYRPPKEWLPNRGAQNNDRSSTINYFTETLDLQSTRFLDIIEIEHNWKNISIIPLQSSSCCLIPRQLAVITMQQGKNFKKRFKISLKCLPQHYTYSSPDTEDSDTTEFTCFWPSKEHGYRKKYERKFTHRKHATWTTHGWN